MRMCAHTTHIRKGEQDLCDCIKYNTIRSYSTGFQQVFHVNEGLGTFKSFGNWVGEPTQSKLLALTSTYLTRQVGRYLNYPLEIGDCVICVTIFPFQKLVTRQVRHVPRYYSYKTSTSNPQNTLSTDASISLSGFSRLVLLGNIYILHNPR